MINKFIIIKLNVLDKKLDDNFYPIKKAFIIWEVSTNQDNWYLNLYISRYIYNKKNSFSKFYSKNYQFVTVNKNIIKLEKIGII